MANVTTIQRKINHGYRIAARHLGNLYAHYRPTSTGPVIVNFNMIDQLMLAFDRDAAFSFEKPQDYAGDSFYGLIDCTTLQIGDYLYDFDNRTFFVANFEPLKPAMLVKCNRTVTLKQPASNNGYGASTGPTLLLDSWPASIIPGTKGERNVAQLPESVRAPWYIMHLPYFPGAIINYGDVILDDLSRRFVVSANQLSPMGWHLTIDMESP